MTNLLAADEAEYVGELERTVDHVADNQEKLKAGEMKQADYDKSLAESKKVVAEIAAAQAKSAPVQTSVARAYTQTGDYALAVRHATTAVELAPKDPFPLTTRGMAHFQSGDFPKAAADAKRALALDPGNPVAKAIYELSKDRVPGGGGLGLQRALARAGREIPSLPEIASLPAGDSSAGGLRPDDDPEIAKYKTEEGRRYARRIIAAEKAMKRRDFLTAFGLANEALATYADNPRVMAARAVSAWNLGEYRATIADATRVMETLAGGHPTMHPMLVARAAASSELGRHADALRDAQTAVELFPRSGRAYLERAIAKEGLRDTPAAALADYKRAAELDAKFTPAYEQALARLTPNGPANEAPPAAEGSLGSQLLAMLAAHGVAATRSDLTFAAIAAGLVCLVAAAAFMLARRG